MSEAELINRLFADIACRLQEYNITGSDVFDLPSLKVIQNLEANNKCRQTCYWAAFIVSVVFITLCLLQWPFTYPELITLLFGFDGIPLMLMEPCLVPLGSTLNTVFRPPVNCGICHNVTSVDRVSKLSVEVFEYRYAYTGRPLIVTDAMANWSAVKTFNFEFFRSMYSEDSPVFHPKEQQCQFFPYRTSFHNLSEVFQMSEDRANLRNGSEPWYIGWSNCDGAAANVLRSHYSRPYFLPNEAESSKTDWIFMGSPHFGAHMHIDNVRNPSWQAQVSGSKLWTLEPPTECYFECIRSKIETVVHSGEIIVLDTNQWFHSTLIVGNEMSITIGSEYD